MGAPQALPGGGTSVRGGRATGALRDRIAIAKRAFKDQLRKEGVPEANLEEAANLLTGQAIAESQINPRAVHDGGTGYGIYGARDDPRARGPADLRRTAMIRWLEANGYAPDSLEGQARYMAHEAMTGKRFGPTRRALMSAHPGNREALTNTLTRNFEAPKFINRRSGDVATAAGVPVERVPGGHSRFSDADLPPATRRPGDDMMGRAWRSGMIGNRA